MNSKEKIDLEGLVNQARELSGLAVTVKMSMEISGEDNCFVGAVSILAMQMLGLVKRMDSLYNSVE